MSTIYIITSGEYSDYHINAVFDDKAKAEAFVDYEKKAHSKVRGYDLGIEEWELNQRYDLISRGLANFEVTFQDINLGDGEAEIASTDDEGETSFARRVEVAGYYAQVRTYCTYVWAPDEQAALKIANERRVQYLLRLEQKA